MNRSPRIIALAVALLVASALPMTLVAPPPANAAIPDAVDGQIDGSTSLLHWILSADSESRGFLLADIGGPSSVTVFWKSINPSDRAALEAEAAKLNLDLSIRPARYSAQEFMDAQKEAVEGARKFSSRGFVVSGTDGLTAEGAARGAGIRLVGHFDERIPAEARHLLEADIKATTAGAAKIGVEDVAESRVRVARTTRVTDVPAFNSGGLMRNPNNGKICSSGFSVNINGVSHITTARHCVDVPYRADSLSSSVYSTSLGSLSGDGAARALDASGSAYMFIGSWSDTTGPRLLTHGFWDVSTGSVICSSGANSGQHCNLRVTNMYVWEDDGYGAFANIRAAASSGIATIQGDSGGPVFYTNGSGYSYAVGMVQFVADFVPCPSGSARYIGGNICGMSVDFTSMRTITTSTAGWQLRTG